MQNFRRKIHKSAIFVCIEQYFFCIVTMYLCMEAKIFCIYTKDDSRRKSVQIDGTEDYVIHDLWDISKIISVKKGS